MLHYWQRYIVYFYVTCTISKVLPVITGSGSDLSLKLTVWHLGCNLLGGSETQHLSFLSEAPTSKELIAEGRKRRRECRRRRGGKPALQVWPADASIDNELAPSGL